MKALIFALILALINNVYAISADVVYVKDCYVEFDDGKDVWGYYFEDQPVPAMDQRVTLIMNTQGTADVMDDTIEMIILGGSK